MGLVTSSRGGSETRPAGHVAGLPGAGCPGSGSLSATMKRGTGLSLGLSRPLARAAVERREASAFLKRERAPRGHARQGVHQLAGRGPRNLPRAFRRSASPFWRRPFVNSLGKPRGANKKAQRENEIVYPPR